MHVPVPVLPSPSSIARVLLVGLLLAGCGPASSAVSPAARAPGAAGATGAAPTGGAAAVPAGGTSGGPVAPAGAGPSVGGATTSGATAASPGGPFAPPTGPGTIVRTLMKPPPWTGGRDPYATLEIYLPPGYAASPARRYPVLYEVPWTFESWQQAIGIKGLLDGSIDSGRLRPLIVVFAAHNGAPYPDSECVDSVDGRQQLETYITTTVVSYVDATYRTIARPEARALFGFSQGGFCAPMLLLRHPDIYRQAIALSGYFQAGVRSGVTPNAWRPFGADAAAIADHSPLVLAGTVPAAVRPSLFLVVSADPRERLYGPQYQRFAAVLAADGYRFLLLPSALGHSWPGVRATLPPALRAVEARWAALGVG